MRKVTYKKNRVDFVLKCNNVCNINRNFRLLIEISGDNLNPFG